MTVFDELERRALKKKSSHQRPKSQLKSIKDKLLLFIFEMRKIGMNVNYVLLLFKASSLLQSFHAKSFSMHYMAVACFIKCHSYTYPMGAHESQRLPEEVAVEVCVWMDHICLLATGPHHILRYVINMDQTPVFFDECKENT